MERLVGIEPTLERWQRSVLPLYDSRFGASGQIRTDTVHVLNVTALPVGVQTHRKFWWRRRESHSHLLGANQASSCWTTPPHLDFQFSKSRDHLACRWGTRWDSNPTSQGHSLKCVAFAATTLRAPYFVLSLAQESWRLSRRILWYTENNCTGPQALPLEPTLKRPL